MTRCIHTPRRLDERMPLLVPHGHWKQGAFFRENRDFELEGQIIAERRRREDRERKRA